MGLPEKREHMMFTQTVNLDVFDNNHFTHIFMKFSRIENSMCIQPISLGEILHGFGNPLRGFLKSLPAGILPKQAQCVLIVNHQIRSLVTASSYCSIFLY